MKDFNAIPGPAPANTPWAAYRLLKTMRAGLLGLFREVARTHGDFVRVTVVGRSQVLALGPEAAHEVLTSSAFEKGLDYTDPRRGIAKFAGQGLFTSNGPLWKRQRRLVAPSFHPRRIATYARAMSQIAEELVSNWNRDEIIAVDEVMIETALQIVARSLFNADIRREAAQISEAMGALHGMIEANNSVWMLLPSWWPTPQRLREALAVRRLDRIVLGLIRERRPQEEADVEDRGDLASVLLLSRDDEGRRMSDRQARDEIVTLFLAGHETTANALSWLFVQLARHPEVRARLEEEVDRVLRGEAPTPEKLAELEYADAVIRESLRLYPPVFLMKRTATVDTGIAGYSIPAGTEIVVVPYTAHRNARFFEDPERFDPERFLGERARAVDRRAWIPFGGGTRLCAGNSFAMMEMLTVLAWVTQRHRLDLVDADEILPVPGATLRPQGPLRMRVSQRFQSASGLKVPAASSSSSNSPDSMSK